MRPPEVDASVRRADVRLRAERCRRMPTCRPASDWLAVARWRLAENARWLDVARLCGRRASSTIGRFGDRYVIGAWIALSAMLALAFVVVHAPASTRAITLAACGAPRRAGATLGARRAGGDRTPASRDRRADVAARAVERRATDGDRARIVAQVARATHSSSAPRGSRSFCFRGTRRCG